MEVNDDIADVVAAKLVGVSPRTRQTLEVAVSDTGDGIPPEVLPRIFELFVQGDHSLGRQGGGGLGIGLTLVKTLVEMHGGTVEAFSEGIGRGSRFTVHLPVLPSDESRTPSVEPAASAMRGSASLKILVVDDNEDIRALLDDSQRNRRPLWMGWSVKREVALAHVDEIDELLADALVALAHVYKLVAWAPDNDLIAATHGRGFWILDVASQEEAIEWAKRAPMTGPGLKTEIRRVTSIDEFPQDNEWIQKERAWREATGQL